MVAALVELCFGAGADDDVVLGRQQAFRRHGSATHGDPAVSGGLERVEDSDRTLIARIQQSDLSAFDDLVDRYYDRVARFAYGFVGERDVAEDLAQDIFLRIWALGAEWAPRGSVAAYLYRATRNRALNVVDRQRVRVRAEQILREDGIVPPPDADVLMVERVAALRVAIANLSERRRTALRLRYEDGLTYPAIASVLSMSTKSAEQLVALSVQALRNALAAFR